MPAHRIYTDDQRRMAYDMFWEDREPSIHHITAKGVYMKGKNTLKEISQQTGVSIAMVWYIARGIK